MQEEQVQVVEVEVSEGTLTGLGVREETSGGTGDYKGGKRTSHTSNLSFDGHGVTEKRAESVQ